MASSSEDIPEASTSQTEDEHKDKKKKFRPLEKMRKFFKSSKKASKSKDSVKAKSTGALHKDTEQSEDDDDGGFARRPMGGARSISEDSVFKPEQKEGGLEAIKQSAVSMEQVNKEFQSTSAGKSTSRESDNSLLSVDGSENEEEDLFSSDWKSSIASVKTIEENSSKKESSSMDLDFATVRRDTQTLTSDAAKHRISIKPKSRRSSVLQSRRVADRTTAPHLPSVTEETTKQEAEPISSQEHVTRQKAEPISSQENVTSIKVSAQPKKEDLPKDSKPDISTVNDRRSSAGTSVKAVEKDSSVITKEKSHIRTTVSNQASLRISERKSDPALREDEVKSVKPRPKSLVDAEPPGVKEESNELSKAFKRMSLRREMVSPEEMPFKSNVQPVKEVKEINISGTNVSETKTPKSPVKTEPQSPKVVESKSPKSPNTKDAPVTGTGKTTYVLKKEPLRTSSTSKSPDYENLQDLKLNKNVTSPSSEYENFPIGGFKSEKSEELSSPEPDYDNLPPVKYLLSPTADKFLPKEVDKTSKAKTSTMPQKLSSPREEYRLKRQPRSRTLPEQPVSREILDSKASETPQEVTNSKPLNVEDKSVSSSPSKRIPSKTNSFKENNNSIQNRFSGSLNSALSEKTAENKIDIESTAKKIEPGRMSLKSGSSVSTTSSWVKTKPKEEAIKPGEPTTKAVVSDSSEKPKFGQLRSASTNKAKEKETPEPSNKKLLEEGKKEIDVSQKPPLKAKPAEIRSSTLDRKAMFENNTSTTSSSTVPAWKANLPQKKGSGKDKEIKIEIIEKTADPEKAEEQKKPPSVQLRGKPPCAEESKASRKSSNVLDMVKNFQSLQAT